MDFANQETKEETNANSCMCTCGKDDLTVVHFGVINLPKL